MRIITCFAERHFPYNCLGLSDEDNSVSQTDNFVNVFNSVTSRELSYCCVLDYFLTMPVGFNFNLTFGLKPKLVASKLSLFTNDPFFKFSGS